MARVLVIEDNAVNLDLARQILQEYHEVLEARDGPQGVALAVRERPDLILLDISLPTLDGFKVAAMLRNNPRTAHIPLVAVTAHAMKEYAERALASGFGAYVVKPIDEKELLATIADQLERRTP